MFENFTQTFLPLWKRFVLVQKFLAVISTFYFFSNLLVNYLMFLNLEKKFFSNSKVLGCYRFFIILFESVLLYFPNYKIFEHFWQLSSELRSKRFKLRNASFDPGCQNVTNAQTFDRYFFWIFQFLSTINLFSLFYLLYHTF